MIRLGMIGSGFMGRTHVEAFSKSNYVGGIHLLTKLPEQGGALRAEFDKVASVTTDEDEFFANRLDAVDICTPTPTHGPLIRRAIAEGCHILCEKPLCLDPAEAARLVGEAEAAGLSFMAAHVIRFWPEFQHLHEVIRSGALGPLRFLRMERYSPLPAWGDWFANLSASGGTLYDLHIHDVDYAATVLGHPLKVSSTGRKADGIAYLDIETSLAFQDGARASIYASYDHPSSTPFRMQYRALFAEGCLDYDIWREEPLVEYTDGGRKAVPIAGDLNGYDRECAYFARCVSEGSSPVLSSATSAVQTLRLLKLIEESADQSGAWLDVKSLDEKGA